MEKKNLSTGLYIMVGLIFLGLMLPGAVNKYKSFDNTVSVKGLCEREVKADRAIWPMIYKVASNDLEQVYTQIEAQAGLIREFLKAGGIEDGEITMAPPKVNDKYAQDYGNNDRQYRYIATCTITVCTDKVDEVLKLMASQSALIKKGIALTTEWDTQTQFKFEGLNSVKPAMIEEATRNAREVAQKFADDSGSRLGRIKDAAQGTFSIEDRDSSTPSVKKVRVVTYVTYYLR